MNGLDKRQHLRVRQLLALRHPASLPGPVTADTHLQCPAQFRQPKLPPIRVNPGVLHRASLAKYAAAFFYYFKLPLEPRILCSQP